jgi:hypothetical protein
MSATAIAQVTVALKELLKATVDNAVEVSLLQPSDTLTKNSINLYLFRVIENAQLRNTDWRGDRTRPPQKTPALALELFYLLTPHADAPQPGQNVLPSAHTLLGTAMRVFHDHPIVNDVHTPGFDFDTLPNVGDLRAAFDKIIVRLQSTSVEELSKIWTMFNQPYRLSIVYQVSLVQIAPTRPARSVSAPVQVTGLDVVPFAPPYVAAIDPSRGGAGTAITLTGDRFTRPGFETRITVGGRPVAATALATRSATVGVPIDLDEGPQQEVRVLLDGRPSEPVIYEVSPWISRLTPQRGAPGGGPAPPLDVIVDIAGEDLQTAAGVAVSLRGAAIAHTVIDSTHLRITIPPTEPNGFSTIGVTANGRSSNTRRFEVVPLARATVPAVPVVGAPVRIDGERLSGTNVRVDFGTATVVIGANGTPTQVQVPRVPRLDPGTYEIRVTVDGRDSNPLSFTVP